jgi:hypothetical protein
MAIISEQSKAVLIIDLASQETLVVIEVGDDRSIVMPVRRVRHG